MKPLEFLFNFLTRFIKFEPGRLTKLRDQAALWETEKVEDPESKVGSLLRKSELWYFQIGFAILFLFGVKFFRDWLTSEPEPEILEDEDEEDNDPVFNKRTGKFYVNN